MKAAAWMLVLAGLGPAAYAADGDIAAGLYGGAGLGSRDVDDESRTVVALYFGAEAASIGPARLGIESGYYDTNDRVGDESGDGYWLGGLLAFNLTPDVRALLRAGADFGDTPGDHAGIGLGYRIEHNMETRFELISLDGDTTMLFSLAYYPFRYRW
ncbi:MAG: hypothetical protein AB7U81_14310 [Thiohalomonadaceae bacterium]